MQDRARSHLCDHLPIPPDIHDVLLWRLAVEVASAHRPGSHGRCTSPLCAGQPYPCRPARNAQAAAHTARRPPPPPPRQTTPHAVGRAAVPVHHPPAPSTPHPTAQRNP
jgi:hypothetical protein